MSLRKQSIKLLFVLVLIVSCIFNEEIKAHTINNVLASREDKTETAILIEIDGRRINFSDQQPVVIDDRTLVPIRGVFEQLGYTVVWDGKANTVALSNDVNYIALTIGSSTFITNQVSYGLDVPACIINGRTMLPLRAVLESIGCSVYWDEDRNTVFVHTNGSDAARVALVLLDGDTKESYAFEVMSNGIVFYCSFFGPVYLLTDDFDMPTHVIEDSDYYKNKQGYLMGSVQEFYLSNTEIGILKEMIDLQSLFNSDTEEPYYCSGGCNSVHALIDGKHHMSWYGSFYNLDWGVKYWDNLLLHDIAYFLIDRLPSEVNKSNWETPKDLVEQGVLDDYKGLSTFYYRYGEEPKTRIVYTDQEKIDNVIQWLEE